MKKTILLSAIFAITPLARATPSPELGNITPQAVKGTASQAPEAVLEITDADKKIKVCWIKGIKADTCVYKCNTGDILEQPMQTPAPQGNSVMPLPCPQLIFPFNPKPQPAPKAAASWKQAGLQAADGTEIRIDYSVLDLGGKLLAAPVWVTVANPRFNGSEKVRAVLMNYYEPTQSFPGSLKETNQLDLQYNGSAFLAKGPEYSIYEGYHAWSHTFRQEIAVFVNGQWLKDPVTGSNNFKFKMTR